MLKKVIIGILLNGLALYAVTKLLADLQYTGGLKFFVVGGVIIGVLNTFIKPLMKLLSFPLILFTAGIFSFVINIIIFWLMLKIVNVMHFGDVSATVTSVLTYVIAGLVFAAVNWLLHLLVRNK